MILENPFSLNETLNGCCELDIEREKKLVDEKLDELRDEGATETTIKEAMKDMGIKR